MATDLASAKDLVEIAVRDLGVDPAAVRAKDTPEQASWTLKRGSASVLVTLVLRQQLLTLRIVSPVLVLPPLLEGRLALFTHVLELNANGLGNCAFGLVGDRLVALSERPVEGLDSREIEQIIRQVAAVADTYDDRLAKDFGAVRASDK